MLLVTEPTPPKPTLPTSFHPIHTCLNSLAMPSVSDACTNARTLVESYPNHHQSGLL